MRKTLLITLLGASLTLAGCIQQTPVENQNVNQPTTNLNQNTNQPTVNANQNVNQPVVNQNQNVNIDIDQPQPQVGDNNQNYKGSNFKLDYPKYLSVKSSTVGVRTTITFTGTKPGNQVESLISVSTMPNQAGSTLSEYSQEIINQSSYVKSGEVTIDGVLAHKLILPESGAGPRYLFISNDGRTIYDLTIQGFDSNDAQEVLSSFILK